MWAGPKDLFLETKEIGPKWLTTTPVIRLQKIGFSLASTLSDKVGSCGCEVLHGEAQWQGTETPLAKSL